MTKSPHYVRCIKPNTKKSPGSFDQELCLHQVRYLGLLENVRVRRAGFAYRQTYETWLGRYKVHHHHGPLQRARQPAAPARPPSVSARPPSFPAQRLYPRPRTAHFSALTWVLSCRGRRQSLCPKTWPTYKGSPRDGVELIMKEMKLGKDDYRLGKTKVFIRSPKTVRSHSDDRCKCGPTASSCARSTSGGVRCAALRL